MSDEWEKAEFEREIEEELSLAVDPPRTEEQIWEDARAKTPWQRRSWGFGDDIWAIIYAREGILQSDGTRKPWAEIIGEKE